MMNDDNDYSSDDEIIARKRVSRPRTGLPKADVLALLRTRLMADGQRQIKSEYGIPRRGIETGLDEAFIVDQATYQALITADARSELILKPYANSSSLGRWAIESEVWLINTPPGTVDIEAYPAIKAHLMPFKQKLAQRNTSQQWFELPSADHIDPAQVADMKIVFRDRSGEPAFTLEKEGTYLCNGGYYLPKGNYFIAGLLNSKAYWFLLKEMAQDPQGIEMDLRPEHLGELPIPIPEAEDLGVIGGIADQCHRIVLERTLMQQQVCREMIRHFSRDGSVTELSKRLEQWHVLEMDEFLAEVKQHFGKDIEGETRVVWEEFLSEGKNTLSMMNTDIVLAESQLNKVVYRMLEMSDEEIEYIERL